MLDVSIVMMVSGAFVSPPPPPLTVTPGTAPSPA